MNGEPLPKEHGYPARLLIPGIYGMKNVKWITRIELVDYDFKGYWAQARLGGQRALSHRPPASTCRPTGRRSRPARSRWAA